MKQFTIIKSGVVIATITAETIRHAAILAGMDRPKFDPDGTYAWQWLVTDDGGQEFTIEVTESPTS